MARSDCALSDFDHAFLAAAREIGSDARISSQSDFKSAAIISMMPKACSVVVAVSDPAPIQTEPTELPVGQIEVNLIAQTPLRSNAEALTDQQHSDHLV